MLKIVSTEIIPLMPCECWIAKPNNKGFTNFNLKEKDFGKFEYLEKIKFIEHGHSLIKYVVHYNFKGTRLNYKQAIDTLFEQAPKKITIKVPPMYIETFAKSVWVKTTDRYSKTFKIRPQDLVPFENDKSFHLEAAVENEFGHKYSIYNISNLDNDDSDAISSDTDFDFISDFIRYNFDFQVKKTTLIFHPKKYVVWFGKEKNGTFSNIE